MWEEIFWGVLIGAIIGTFVLSWDTISRWFNKNRTTDSTYGLLIKEALDGGTYKVIGGVFNSKNKLLASKVWGNSQIDAELLRRFGANDQLVVFYED